MQPAGADHEVIGIAPHAVPGAFGHRPGIAARAIHRHVDGAVIGRAVAAAELVIGGKDAPDKGDDRQAEAAVVAAGVDVPPGIALRVDLDVEARSLSRISTANPPLRAAIGTPAPGCVLPPAQ